MINQKIKEIREFFLHNASPEIVKKYSRYFKEGFDGYGIEQKTFENQRDLWIKQWHDNFSLDDYLNMADEFMANGKYEEKSISIALVNSRRTDFTPETFDRIGKWFELGIDNWATTDVLCMLVIPSFIRDEIISLEKLSEWNKAKSEWQRRVTPVTLNELVRDGIKPSEVFPLIENLMEDPSEYVQKGTGTLLRSLWKKYPGEVEDFLMKWKESCGRLIVQYACEKMDKEDRKRFRRGNK